MQYVGLGRWLKRDISYDDILTVFGLIRLAEKEIGGRRRRYYKRVVEVLTSGSGFVGGKVRWYHLLLVKPVLKAADMLSDEKVQDDPKEVLLHFVSWLAVRLNMTPRQILSEFNQHTLLEYYKEAVTYLFKLEVARGTAAHAPVKFLEMVSELYQYKMDRRIDAFKAREAEINETITEPDTAPIITTLSQAFD